MCDVDRDYFKDNATGQCEKCGLGGCKDCASAVECAVCNESSDYFLEEGVCLLCHLSSCLDCLNLSACRQCDEMNDYFLEGGLYKQCQLEVFQTATVWIRVWSVMRGTTTSWLMVLASNAIFQTALTVFPCQHALIATLLPIISWKMRPAVCAGSTNAPTATI